ncbi:hypothetical protein F5X99DRAFT_406298 [Biscogniauxia marginata]|nr:hypothetical protein F5X99DRAFT_406298 [Biscogniauxia marginata]
MEEPFIQLNAGGQGGSRPPQHPSGPGAQHAGPGRFPPAPSRGILPVDMRGGPAIQVVDVRQDFLSEADMADQLTEYVIYRFEKMPEREYDDDGQPLRPTWDKAIRSQVRTMSQKETARRIRYLDRHSQSLVVKRNSLSLALQRQIDKAQQQLASTDPDLMNFQWVLAQIEHQLKAIDTCTVTRVPQCQCAVPRKHCSLSKRRPKPCGHRSSKKKKKTYERISLTTYFKRIPRPEAHIPTLWANRRRMASAGQTPAPQPPPNQPRPPPPPPAGGPPQGGGPGGPPRSRPGGPGPVGPGGPPAHGGKGGKGGKGDHRGHHDGKNKENGVIVLTEESESEPDAVFSSPDESSGTPATSQSSGSRDGHHGRRGRPRREKPEFYGVDPSRNCAWQHHILGGRPMPMSPPPPPPPPPPPTLSDCNLERAYLEGMRHGEMGGRRPPPPRFTRAHQVPINPADLHYRRDLVIDDDYPGGGNIPRFAHLSLDDSDDYDAELRRHGGRETAGRRRRRREFEYPHPHPLHGSIMSGDPFAESGSGSSSLSSFPREARRPRRGGGGGGEYGIRYEAPHYIEVDDSLHGARRGRGYR